jgi:hypothetical protein
MDRRNVVVKPLPEPNLRLAQNAIPITLRIAGSRVELREPDIVASGNGLSKPLAIACENPSSRQQYTTM